MRSLRVLVLVLLAPLLFGSVAVAQDTRPFNVHDLVMMNRVSGAQVSPDGKWVAYVLRSTDLEADKGTTDLWLASVAGEGEPRRLTTHEASDSSPCWAPDGKSLFFLSSRSGSSQVWRLPLGGGEAQQVSDLELDVANLVVSRDGKHLAVSADVFVDCEDLACTAKRLEQKASSTRSGALYDRIFMRHWDTWKDGRRSHLLVLPSGGGKPVDVTAGFDADVPSKPFGGAGEITFTPDSQSIVFTARMEEQGEPWSTDFNLWVAPIDGSAPPRRLTDSPAWDTHPVFSPDGKTLAYTAMKRARFEADRHRIVLRPWPEGPGRDAPPDSPRGDRILTEDWDRSVGNFFFSPDGKTIYATAQDLGETKVFAIDVASGKVKTRLAGGHVVSAALAGERLVFGADFMNRPVDLYTAPAGESTAPKDFQRITDVNRERLAAVAFGDFEQFSFPGWNGETVYGWIVKPVDFEPGKKYPIAFLIHGGPQGSWQNQFHYRWNPQIYAGAGLRGGDDRLPRFHRLWSGVHRLDLHRLGWQAARGPEEGICRGAGALRLARRRPGLRPGRLLRRLHGQLDRRQLARLPMPGQPRRSLRHAVDVLQHRRALVPGVGSRGHAVHKS